MPYRSAFLGPRALRFFVLALAVLQMVAPTWHLCALGGHIGNNSASHHAAPVVISEPNQPLICFCAPQAPPLDPKTPRLDDNSNADHATCLALLLQTMPGQIAAPAPVFASRLALETAWQTRRVAAPFCAALPRFRGRAPPEIC